MNLIKQCQKLINYICPAIFQPPDLEKTRTVYANQNSFWDEESFAVRQNIKPYADNFFKTYKYGVWTFLPINLFEQFQKLAHFYFLCIVIVQCVLRNQTPVSLYTNLAQFLCVIFVTAFKQGYEDWLRHKADRQVNYKKVVVIKNSAEQDMCSKDLKVGDIVKVIKGEEFPCDMVVISISEGDSNKCSIMTANLDGDTDLKTRYSLEQTAHLNSPAELSSFIARVDCDNPDSNIYKFSGKMILGNSKTKYSLDINNLLLKGSTLMNTDFVYGLVIYTGKETKMALNGTPKRSKLSQIERKLNKFLLAFFCVLVIEVLVCVCFKLKWEKKEGKAWYLRSDYCMEKNHILFDLLSFLILFSDIIPISLYGTLEIQKFFAAQFFTGDSQLKHKLTNEPAEAITLNIIEDLGQIEYVFSDKTGTLTENKMCFQQCSIGGTMYKEKDNQLIPINQANHDYDFCLTDEMKEFFIALALCHSLKAIEISQDKDIQDLNKASYKPMLYKYQASSSDEKALCEVSSRFGIIFKNKVNDFMELEVCGKFKKYKILHVLEFDSNRKRMSIILETPTKDIVMYCKGADSHIIPRCITGPVQETIAHINKYALEGLRTLTVASRNIAYHMYEEINNQLLYAQNSTTNREELLAEAFNKLENDFHLLGATAVDDKLQDGVKETIESLREAGIKVWVLTGDKQETAVNISYSCAHFTQEMDVTYLTKKKTLSEVNDELIEALEKLEDDSDKIKALVVDGSTLSLILKNCADKFIEFGKSCEAVLCCRMSPFQKAQVVRLVKESDCEPITLAIGDGANDCSMIQEAHVGCGVMGNEGRHAVRYSDYAFHRFYNLKRVLLVHGNNYYSRLATVVLYFFYKNIVFITPQFFFQMYNGFSGQSMYPGVFLTTFNILFTSMPILLHGIFEINFEEETLMKHPNLYKDLVRNANLSLPNLAFSILAGVKDAVVIFFVIMFVVETSFISNMQDYSFFEFGIFVFIVVVFVTNIKIVLITKIWKCYTHLCLWGTIVLYLCIVFFISRFNWPWPWIRETSNVPYDFSLYDSFNHLALSSPFLLSLIIIAMISFIPDYLFSILEQCINCSAIQYFQVSTCTNLRRHLHRLIVSTCTNLRRHLHRLIIPRQIDFRNHRLPTVFKNDWNQVVDNVMDHSC